MVGSKDGNMNDLELEANNHPIGVEEISLPSCSNSVDDVYTSQVSEGCKPKVGQEFESIDEVHEFYIKYSKEVGFSVRSNSSKRRKDTNEVVRKEFVCYKEGVSSKKVGETKRCRGITRENCRAKLAVVRSKLGKYVVSVFVEEHSHPLSTPQKVHLLRSHRNVLEAKKSLAQQFSAANIPTHQQISISEFQAGGIENSGCTKKDIYDHETRLRNEMRRQDAELLKEFFLTEQEKDPSFIFEIEVDDDCKLKRCFWVDSVSRRAYGCYGDVIVFDTIYNTNQYGMIFATLVGVNNHGQTVLFVCAFLSDEKTESFVWLFELLKKTMPSNNPKMIITNQDPAMTKAIVQSLPNTFHRYCTWHILEKFSIQVDAITYRDFYKDFQTCIWESECPEEFERKWVTIVEKANLYDNDWLKSIFEIRSRWVPAYVNHIFSAGMSSSQRAESFHAFFKEYVSKKNFLMDFILRFNRVLAHQRHEELCADHVDINEKPLLKLPLEMEKQMAEIYTCRIFYKFQDELWHSLVTTTQLARENDTHKMYKVKSSPNEEVPRVREIAYDKVLDFASCSCKKFESEGIPCRHILAYLRLFGNILLPNQYIMKRWTKVAKSQVIFDKHGVEINGKGSSIFMWRTKLFQLASEVIDKAITDEEASVIVKDGLETLLDKIKSVVDSTKSGDVSEKDSNVHETILKDPSQVRAKGCGRRLNEGKEKATNAVKYRGRRCNGCEKIGQLHDKRNYPVLNNRSSQFEENPQQSSEFESEADSFNSTGLH